MNRQDNNEHSRQPGKNVLVTGASGFIGSFLVEEALQRGYNVYAGIRAGSSKVHLQDPRINFFELDYSNPQSLEKSFSGFKDKQDGFKFIFHNAGITRAKLKEEFFTVNHQYTKNLVDSLIQSGTIPGKFIYMSSMAAGGPGTGRTPITETQISNPVTSYGHSKLNSEHFLKSLNDFPNLILRPASVYGPRDREFFILIKMIRMSVEAYMGSKDQLLSFVFVRDLARVTFDAAESSLVGQTYMISDGSVYTARDFNEVAKKHLRKKTITILVPNSLIRPIAWSVEKVSALFGLTSTFNRERAKEFMSPNWACDIAPLVRDLNFSAEDNLDTGLQKTIGWYKTNGWL